MNNIELEAGNAFGYMTPNSELVQDREWEGEMSLNQDGDHLLMYCINADSQVHFISGLTFGLPWAPAGQASYRPGESALPESLDFRGNVELEDLSNWYYNGTLNLSVALLKDSFVDESQWVGSDTPFQVGVSGAATAAWNVGVMGMLVAVTTLWFV